MSVNAILVARSASEGSSALLFLLAILAAYAAGAFVLIGRVRQAQLLAPKGPRSPSAWLPLAVLVCVLLVCASAALSLDAAHT